tara:strand:+ start:36427 stop:36615 length:189 start_codon:yes stop_codon:yes gene_type:complete
MSTPMSFDHSNNNAHTEENGVARPVWVAPKRTSLAVQRTSGTNPASNPYEPAVISSFYAPTS